MKKEANHTTWTAEDDATIVRMIAGGSSYHKNALAIGKGLRGQDINNRWHRELKESSAIIKPPVKTGPHSSWTAEDDAIIVRMIMHGSSYPEIALAMGIGLKVQVISNR